MSDHEIQLTERDYYLLGVLAEEVRGHTQALRRYPEDGVVRLVRGGYLERVTLPAWNGREAKHYRITPKGRAAWRTHRFTDPKPSHEE
ncbi:hypothetical protein AA309_20840 [Microvirga vignae]|uniref:Transcription regulator PadR N-terminal domain-containing protein n=1 Tax=Microvirga vignae TaxID=1225564 RepID=A0A0H1R8D7_9HYPH|nr:hypothetical protein [Microvirga vignae]KLK91309.1 hypothetical protein AA309_20840 [Microvirga vignae]